MNKKQTIRLNESQLRRIVRESVRRMLNEAYDDKEYARLLAKHGGYAENDTNNSHYQNAAGNVYSHVSIDDVEWVAPNEDAAYGYLKAIYGRGSDVYGELTRDFWDDIPDIEYDRCTLLKDGSVIIFKNGAKLGSDKRTDKIRREREDNYYNYKDNYQPVMNSKNHKSYNNDDFYFTKNSDYADKMRNTIDKSEK